MAELPACRGNPSSAGGQSWHVETNARARVRAGDPDAFRELFDEYARSVYNHAFRLVGDWSAAEDVVSLTFLEAWRLRERIDPDAERGSLRPWLLGVATNVARNVRRAARRYEDALARLPAGGVVPDFAEDADARVDDSERIATLRTALAALRRPEREVLALCLCSGLDYAEAAEALGIPVGTVRSRLSRARRKVKKLIAAGRLEPPGGGRELASGSGQEEGDRTIAVRSAQENAR
ncbi:ECF subfamily RNA polymerase sigma-24 subunit [Actinomadura verrucosospora]|uniref:ECF subfamily RNA polymerase sigma-24 subunit n=1 Tax=Actinomadura verrucosospora TaxID=46165 RepID=A0A7D3ZQ81_ACTVE|nr:ECF subfamily RNA polymerase sigma-24 subunit [Actinomadura verrucosospora]